MIYDRPRKLPPGSLLTGLLTCLVLGLVVAVIGLSIEGMSNELARGPSRIATTLDEVMP
jgi:hypothetical protein